MSERDDIVREAWRRIAMDKRLLSLYMTQPPPWHLIAAELADMLAEERRRNAKP